MIEADQEKYRGHWDAAYADDDGKYSFKFIPAGRYVLQIRFDGLTSQTRPFPTMYFPGVADKSQATLFAVAEGQAIEKDLVVPPMLSEYEVSGTVTWSNGLVVPDARLEYEIPNEAIAYGAKIDDQGRFKFKAYEGLRVVMRATVERKGQIFYSNWVTVNVANNPEPVKLVMIGPE
jgi:hypothetical protein